MAEGEADTEADGLWLALGDSEGETLGLTDGKTELRGKIVELGDTDIKAIREK